jgi:transcriptional regulator with XRE-family HTH domain
MNKDNKNIFATNLNNLMNIRQTSRKDLSEALGISYFTITAWVNGTKYPRMDKVEMLANYFGVLKSDLIEERGTDTLLTADPQLFDSPKSEEPKLTEAEEMLLELFRRVPENKQEVVLEMIRLALKTQG